MRHRLLQIPIFTDKETEAQANLSYLPKAAQLKVVELRFKYRDIQVHCFDSLSLS